MKKIYLIFCFFSILPIHLFAQSFHEPKICMILDKAGKNDHSFNEEAYNGFQKALKNKMISNNSKVIEAKDDEHLNQVIHSFINEKCSAIFTVGINNSNIINKIAPQFPNQIFVVIDSTINQKNVRSIVFKDEQGAFLMGVISAIKSKTGAIGIIGGMDIPLIHKFVTSYTAGAKYINPKIKINTNYVGISSEAWSNPSKAQEIALSQFNQGVDIIFHAAGASGMGVFNAAETLSKSIPQKFVIGCDSNQNKIKPGIVLTSMIKNVEKSVIDTFNDIIENKFKPGIYSYDISNQGINWALDDYNKKLFNINEIKKINSIKEKIALNIIQTSIKEARN